MNQDFQNIMLNNQMLSQSWWIVFKSSRPKILGFSPQTNFKTTLPVWQTTQKDVSPLLYISNAEARIAWVKNAKLIHNLTYQIRFSPESLAKNFFTKLGRRVKQRNSLFKSFLNLKHTIESRVVSIILNLFFYVFKGNS